MGALERLDVIERKAIVRLLIFRAARAQIHKQALPWWAWLSRRKHNWSIVAFTLAAADIERGEQHLEQAQWLNDIDGGQAIVESIEHAVTKRVAPAAQHDGPGERG